MAENNGDSTEDIRQRKNDRRRELYRIHRASETPQRTDERRRRSREYMRTRQARINSEEQRRINCDYMQRRRARVATQNCHNRFDLNREPNNARVNSSSIPTLILT